MSHYISWGIGIATGWLLRGVVRLGLEWLNRPKCEICGGEPFALVSRVAFSRSTGEIREQRHIVLCRACDAENDAAVDAEFAGMDEEE